MLLSLCSAAAMPFLWKAGRRMKNDERLHNVVNCECSSHVSECNGTTGIENKQKIM